MKKISSKIPAMIGLLWSTLSFVLVISALIISIDYPEEVEGIGVPFGLWIYSVMAAMLSVFCYIPDGVLCVIRVCQGKRIFFNILLAVLVTGSVPMVIYVGGGLGINILIWNIYYLAVCTLEVISIVQLFKDRRANKITE